MQDNMLKLKRNRDLSTKNLNFESSIKKVEFYDRGSHIFQESRNITFIDEIDNINIMIHINSKEELSKKLIELHFNYPFYKIQNKDFLISISNVEEFFHNVELNEIYNYKYHNLIDENSFENQYNSLANNLSVDPIFLNKIFLEHKDFYSVHLKNYDYIIFKYHDLDIFSLRDLCCDKIINIVEIFGKSNIGKTLTLFLFFSQFRSRIRTTGKFIPFIIFDFQKLKQITKLNTLYDLLYFSLINLFVNYNEYQEFTSQIFFKIISLGFNIEKIILKICEEFLELIKNKNMFNVPCIIIDNYVQKKDFNQNFYFELISLQQKFEFKIIFVYFLNDPLSNQALLNYLIEDKKESFKMLYGKTLYGYIEKIPFKYSEQFKNITHSISNLIKLENCNSEYDALQIVKNEEIYINNLLLNFYEGNMKLRNLYLNQIVLLINKILNCNEPYIQNILKNIPLNIFDIDIGKNKKIKISYTSKVGEKVINKICSESIFDIIHLPIFKEFDNFIKDGLFERTMKEIFISNNSIFGTFEHIINFGCLLNFFPTNKSYNFTKKQIKEKLNGLKSVKNLIKKYQDFIFRKRLIILTKQKTKDWDFGLIEEVNNNINFCVIQISINKTISEIKNMLSNIKEKIKFMKMKIKEILNINIDNTHILFILLRTTQNKETIYFLKKYKIPFIFYDINSNNFMNDNYENISNFLLNNKTSYANNIINWKNSLIDNSNKNSKNELESEEEIEEEEESENNKQDTQKKNIEDIIYNKDIIL